ncbi:Reticulocyte-binding protein-like protein, partial [Colletotrichum scovillei]
MMVSVLIALEFFVVTTATITVSIAFLPVAGLRWLYWLGQRANW